MDIVYAEQITPAGHCKEPHAFAFEAWAAQVALRAVPAERFAACAATRP